MKSLPVSPNRRSKNVVGAPTCRDNWRNLWKRVLSVSIRTKILGMVVGILVYWLILVLARRLLVVRLFGPQVEAETFVNTILLVSVLLFLPPSLLFAYLLTKAMTTPILELTRIAKAVSQGDLSQRAKVHYDDEIGKLAVAFNRMLDELSRAMEEVRRHSAARTHLLRRLISAQEEERRRVAQELHDRTSQWLASLTIYLKVLEESVADGEQKQKVKQLQDVASQLMQDVHQLAWELRPYALDHLGLVDALGSYVREWSQRAGISIDLQVSGFEGERLPPHLETTLYRILQEAISNIVKHAQATQASLVLQRHQDKVRAVVEDNGVGFDVERVIQNEEPEKRLGLLGMQERAELVGGKVHIESSPRQGTSVFVELPLRGD